MSRRSDGMYLEHMLEASQKAISLTENLSRADYDADEVLRLALAHIVQTIGEAARLVSSETRALHLNVPWAAIVGMRHKVVHDYMHVRYDILWETVRQDLPVLTELLRSEGLSVEREGPPTQESQ